MPAMQWGSVGLYGLLFLFLTCACAAPRKDLQRNGKLKLYGEKPVRLEHKDPGDLLQSGDASWYGVPYHGRQTSSGEIYDMNLLTAAHKTLPFGTVVRVVNQSNDKEVRVKINDRGPFVRGRVIDLSRRAAEEIGLVAMGIAPVRLYLDTSGRVSELGAKPRGPKINSSEHSSDFYWMVQVGSFKDPDRARALVERMRGYGWTATTERSGAFTRVRVGRFERRADADALALRFYDDGIDCWIVSTP